MGKHKKQSVLRSKRNSEPITHVDENIRQKEVLPLIAGIKSLNETERLNAITAISEVISSKSVLHMLLRERLIKIILTTTLSDSNLEIVAGSLQVLRLISLSEGRDPSLYMIREHIKMTLEAIATKVIDSLKQSSTLTSEQSQITFQLAEQCMGLISAILISVGELTGIDQTLILAAQIIQGSSLPKLPPSCIVAAFELIYYVSETNPEALMKALNGSGVEQLESAAGSVQEDVNTWAVRTYTLGTEFNLLVNSSALDLSSPKSAEQIRTVVEKLCAFFKEIPETESTSLQVCLELLAIASQTDDIDILTVLVSEAHPRVLELLQKVDLKANCISVLNNIGWSLNGLEQDWSDISTSVITSTMESCFSNLSMLTEQDPELTSMALGLLGSAILQNTSNVAASDNTVLSQLVNEVMKLIEHLHSNNDLAWVDVTRSLVVLLAIPIDGTTTIAAKLGLIRQVSQQIFLILEHSQDAEAHIDVLNALYDVFSDNDASFNESEYNKPGLNGKLEHLKPTIKRTLKSIPKNEPARRQQALDTLTNLDQFIIYKRG